MLRRLPLLLLCLAATTLSADWPYYAGGPESTRYSPLKQITPANVGSLAVAWTYDTGDAFKGSEMQCRAFDPATGKVLWETTLPASGTATPAVYEVNGRQFVVIAAGGGRWGGPSGGSYVAFALP